MEACKFCHLFLKYYPVVYLILACSSCILEVLCDNYNVRMRAILSGVENGRFLPNDYADAMLNGNVNIDQLINLDRIVFQDLLDNDVAQNNEKFVEKHRILHRSGVGPFRIEIDPNNAHLLNDTVKKILSQMMNILLTPSTALPMNNESMVENPCTKLCQNGGACQKANDINAEHCFCLMGFQGEYCEFQNDCNRPPGCGPFSLCVNESGHLRCRCEKGYVLSGTGCLAGGKCREVTCQNGGTCLPLQLSTKHDNPKEFSCDCKLGFRGKFCEEVIPDCGETACKPNQVCVAGQGISYCVEKSAVIKKRHRTWDTSWKTVLWIFGILLALFLIKAAVTKCIDLHKIRDQKRKKDSKILRNGNSWTKARPNFNNQSVQFQPLLQDASSDEEAIFKDGGSNV